MAVTALQSAPPAPPPFARGELSIYIAHFPAMGGANSIAVAAGDRETASEALAAAVREVRRIEAKFSRYNPDSVVSLINAGAGSSISVPCDAETDWLLDRAGELHALSDGLFDLTSGVLRRAWNFAKPEVPAELVLAPLRALIGWQRVERSPGFVALPEPGMQIDFGGIGKEYAADRAAQAVRALGLRHGYVNLGGDIAVIGPQPDGSAWPIGVEHPRHRGTLAAHIAISRGGLTTSGDSEKFFEIGDKRYCHILNPKTGMPADHWASISVHAASALSAGAISTIAMLKEREGLTFLQQQGCGFLAFDKANNCHTNRTTN